MLPPKIIEQYMDLHSGWVAIPSQNESIIEFTGEDAFSWLQGQVTQDMNLVSSEVATHAFFCKPNGFIEAFCHLIKLGDSILVVTTTPEKVLSRVENFVISEDVVAKLLSGKLYKTAGNYSVMLFEESYFFQECPEAIFLPSPMGRDVYFPEGSEPLSLPEPIDADLWSAYEIANGHYRFGIEFDESSLPSEMGKYGPHALSHEKGCYVGQEIIHRMYARGVVKKFVVCLRSEGSLTVGAEVQNGGKTIGKVHRSAYHPTLGWISTTTLPSNVIEAKEPVQVSNMDCSINVTLGDLA